MLTQLNGNREPRDCKQARGRLESVGVSSLDDDDVGMSPWLSC